MFMVIKKEVFAREKTLDVLALRLEKELGCALRTSTVSYFFTSLLPAEEQSIAEILADHITESCVSSVPFPFSWMIEVGFKAGVTDTVAATTQILCADTLQKDLTIKTATRYYFLETLPEHRVKEIARSLGNELIHHITCTQQDGFFCDANQESLPPEVMTYTDLITACKERELNFPTSDLEAIAAYLRDPSEKARRQTVGIQGITDCELEMLAQTWSEHCKHRIFNARIRYSGPDGTYAINSLFATFIKAATQKINNQECLSVFSDNAGIIAFDDFYALACKVETHNSPSAKVPLEGALTGVGGLGRDLNGAGLGAKPIAYIDVLCFPPPHKKDIPPGILSPQEIIHGVLRGIEQGGNKMGVPTVNGSITFHDSYIAKPLVYCGGIGIMPREIQGKKTHEKKAQPGNLIVVLGGRVGKDGIHGATFSSTSLQSNIPSSVVQRGDPFTQKKVQDLILEARDKGLYTSVTDNGAGGLSCSVGEMAQESKGCVVHLEKVQTKYSGLQPWEIWLSESQERMTLAVPQENMSELVALAKKHDVEATVIGEFAATGFCTVFYDAQPVCSLSLDFLHKGCPQLVLEAEWHEVICEEKKPPLEENYTPILEHLLGHPTIASKEQVVRKFDHEVQGHTVGKPFVGYEGPADAAVLQPLFSSEKGVVVAHGICPRYSMSDPYAMAQCAFDEAVRNALAVGADPAQLYALDNFCWSDAHNKEKVGMLVQACKGLYDYALAYHIPFISGKDSMWNDYVYEEEGKKKKLSVVPTLLITIIGIIDDIAKRKSMDVKQAGDLVYLIGETKDEMSGSFFYELYGGSGLVPRPSPQAQKWYRALHDAWDYLSSVHDCSDGGLAVALAESAFGGGVGMEITVQNTMRPDTFLFSESASRFVVTVSPKNQTMFERAMHSVPLIYLGIVVDTGLFTFTYNGKRVISSSVTQLRERWQTPW